MKALVDALNNDPSKELLFWGAKDLTLDETRLGLKGSPTKVKKSFSPTITRSGEILGNNVKDAVSRLKDRLKERHLI